VKRMWCKASRFNSRPRTIAINPQSALAPDHGVTTPISEPAA
jgi:hypothetical protein